MLLEERKNKEIGDLYKQGKREEAEKIKAETGALKTKEKTLKDNFQVTKINHCLAWSYSKAVQEQRTI